MTGCYFRGMYISWLAVKSRFSQIKFWGWGYPAIEISISHTHVFARQVCLVINFHCGSFNHKIRITCRKHFRVYGKFCYFAILVNLTIMQACVCAKAGSVRMEISHKTKCKMSVVEQYIPNCHHNAIQQHFYLLYHLPMWANFDGENLTIFMNFITQIFPPTAVCTYTKLSKFNLSSFSYQKSPL